MRCAACRRLLMNPVSIKHGLGPDCLRRAAKDGTASMESLVELAQWKRSNRPEKTATKQPEPVIDTRTIDLFAGLREQSITDLHLAADKCRSYGLNVSITFHSQE